MTGRLLVVTADDFGIGPATSAGILDLAAEGLVSATVLLVNSPFAADAVALWQQRGCPVPLGWHPCLTLDSPLLPARQVASLVRPDGRFWSLGEFLPRLVLRRIRLAEAAAELQAQLERFRDLTGGPPAIVNGHHHLHVLPGVADVMEDLLGSLRPVPYLRRVRESLASLVSIPGARLKRGFLSWLGQARFSSRFPGNDALIGVTDPRWVSDPLFLTRWLGQTAGRVVELTCHPGQLDGTLPGRDGGIEDMHRRVEEMRRLREPIFRAAYRAAGFTLFTPGPGQVTHAA